MSSRKFTANTTSLEGQNAHKLLFDLHSQVSTIKQSPKRNVQGDCIADRSEQMVAKLLDKIETHVPLILFHDLQDTPVARPMQIEPDLADHDPHEVALDALETTLVDLRDAFDEETDPNKSDRLAGKILRQEAKIDLLRDSWG